MLTGVRRDVSGDLGAAVSVAHPARNRGGGRLSVLAASGVGEFLTSVTTGKLWGPSILAAVGEGPLATADIWHDERWPHLSLERLLHKVDAAQHELIARVRGAAAIPSIWDEDGIVVLSIYLDGPADDGTVATLARHEPLVTSAVTMAGIAERNQQQSQRVLDALASRAAIEQAKGVIMGIRNCGPNAAWDVLRAVSQEANVKLRELATALVEHIGQVPADKPTDQSVVHADERAREIAAKLWSGLGQERTTGETHIP
ncbi:ANTAR domain-containing protein [Sciscionella sediminilitoris]|uniref:ANTAR domain-containing protein n=1 Tax=Sciscionella sediminilitoris TaxID=1445613 RepID=UPI001E42DDF8|nr:ANTAR domain-containing protein [Sciscionella sp. SE31]